MAWFVLERERQATGGADIPPKDGKVDAMKRTLALLSATLVIAPSVATADPIMSIDVPFSFGNPATDYKVLDDALTTSTRAHTDDNDANWDGSNFDPLPSFIQGADYVQTYGPDDGNPDFLMDIKLSEPANIYILHSMTPPSWITKNYTERKTIRFEDRQTVYNAQIHQRKVTTPTTISTYANTVPLNDPILTDRMYGVAATPLQTDVPVGKPLWFVCFGLLALVAAHRGVKRS